MVLDKNTNCLEAELWALLDGVEIAWSAGYTHIKVEVNCLLVLIC